MKREYIGPVVRVISEDMYILAALSDTDLGGPVLVEPKEEKPLISPNAYSSEVKPADAKDGIIWDDSDWW